MEPRSDDNGYQPARRRRRLALVAVAAIIASGWSWWLSQPDPPGPSSTEAGYVHALNLHAQQSTDALEFLLDDLEAGSPHADPIREARDAHARLADLAEQQLTDWGVAGAAPADPIAWMGHVPPGEIPGDLDFESLVGMPGPARFARTSADLALAVDGASLMARAALDLSDDVDLERLAGADLDVDQSLRTSLQEARIAAGIPPAAVVPAVTTDPGELDHGGDPVDSFGQALSDALRVAPLLLAAGAALVAFGVPTRPSPRRGLFALAGVASLGAGLLHGGLIGAHYADAAVGGIFFAVVAVVQTGLGALLLAGRRLLGTAALASGGVTCVYAIFRLVPAPGQVGPATVDVTGIATMVLQLVVVAVWVIDTTDLGPKLARIQAELAGDDATNIDQ